MRDNAAYLRDYYVRYARAARGHEPRHPNAPLAAVILAAEAAGISRRQFSLGSGVSGATIRRIILNPDATTTAAIARRVRAHRPPRPVTAIGLTRRLRALAVLGWSSRAVAEVSGLNLDTVKAWRRGDVTEVHGIAPAVLAAYDELSMRTPPNTERYERTTVNNVRNRAQRAGWLPPLAWDEGEIDNPDAIPDTGEKVRGIDIDEWLYIVKRGEDPNRAASRLGVQITAIERAAHRAGRSDIAWMASSARIREEKAS